MLEGQHFSFGLQKLNFRLHRKWPFFWHFGTQGMRKNSRFSWHSALTGYGWCTEMYFFRSTVCVGMCMSVVYIWHYTSVFVHVSVCMYPVCMFLFVCILFVCVCLFVWLYDCVYIHFDTVKVHCCILELMSRQILEQITAEKLFNTRRFDL